MLKDNLKPYLLIGIHLFSQVGEREMKRQRRVDIKIDDVCRYESVWRPFYFRMVVRQKDAYVWITFGWMERKASSHGIDN